jgi:hypothetical protein
MVNVRIIPKAKNHPWLSCPSTASSMRFSHSAEHARKILSSPLVSFAILRRHPGGIADGKVAQSFGEMLPSAVAPQASHR